LPKCLNAGEILLRARPTTPEYFCVYAVATNTNNGGKKSTAIVPIRINLDGGIESGDKKFVLMYHQFIVQTK
jgi:hypothetical protein